MLILATQIGAGRVRPFHAHKWEHFLELFSVQLRGNFELIQARPGKVETQLRLPVLDGFPSLTSKHLTEGEQGIGLGLGCSIFELVHTSST